MKQSRGWNCIGSLKLTQTMFFARFEEQTRVASVKVVDNNEEDEDKDDKPDDGKSSLWKKVWSEADKDWYWYNPDTNETTWDNPNGM